MDMFKDALVWKIEMEMERLGLDAYLNSSLDN